MITDRRRLGAGAEDALVARVAAAARAGVHLVQVREPDLEGHALLRLVERCLAATSGMRTRVLVNDRVDIALAAGAHGVHLRGDSVDARRVRPLTPRGFLVGRSVHSIAEARDAAAGGGVDYLVFGTVFETDSKPGRTAAGCALLRAVVSATAVPVLAVGGVTARNASQVADTGAAGVAAIGLFHDVAIGQLPHTLAAIGRAFAGGRVRFS